MNQPSRIVVKARDVMNQSFIEMEGLMTVKDALISMKEARAQLVIIKKRNEHGLVLLSDIAKKVLAKDKAPERVNLYEIMTKPLVSVLPDMDVRYCARLFNQFGLSSAPVIVDGKVMGIVSYNEMVFEGLLVEGRTLD